MQLRLDPDFTLIEGGVVTSGADILPETAAVVDVAKADVRGLIAALLSTGSVHILRDSAVPPASDDGGDKVWLQTSGTTGRPTWAGHSRESLSAKIAPGSGEKARWLLSFHPGSFAGLQVILSAMAGGHDLVVPPMDAHVAAMADLAVSTSVTHVSGTPTFWRAFLMALGERPLALKSVTLGGEAADQAILDALSQRFPQARLRHIYATTEAGTVFSVRDGRAGFPRHWLGDDLSLTAQETLAVKGYDTGDVVELSENRVLFRGRFDAMVNIGGVKIYPEAVEIYMLELSFIQDVRVIATPSPITGYILTAEIVLKPDSGSCEAQIKAHLQALPRARRPVRLRYVDGLVIGATGKKSRSL